MRAWRGLLVPTHRREIRQQPAIWLNPILDGVITVKIPVALVGRFQPEHASWVLMVDVWLPPQRIDAVVAEADIDEPPPVLIGGADG